MNRKEFDRRVTSIMRENGIRKPVSSPKQVFHISDDEGNKKDFIIRKTDKSVAFTIEDIEAVVDTCIYVIMDALKNGEDITFRGFGSLGVHHRKARATKRPDTGEWVEVGARYVPKFTFGNDLRMCAKLYELSLNETNSADILLPDTEDTYDGEDGE